MHDRWQENRSTWIVYERVVRKYIDIALFFEKLRHQEKVSATAGHGGRDKSHVRHFAVKLKRVW